MEKTLYILNQVNEESEIVACDAYKTMKEAQAAMKKSYKTEFKDMVEAGYSKEDIEDCSNCGESCAALGWGLAYEFYKWDISTVVVDF